MLEICIGLILAQNTSWGNADKALMNLKRENTLTLQRILFGDRDRLLRLVRPAGLHNRKSDYLDHFAKYVVDHYNGDFEKLFEKPVDVLRKELLGIRGIGTETCDAIMLYAGNKPIFIVDQYSKRILSRMGIMVGGAK